MADEQNYLDQLCPRYVGARLFVLSLSELTPKPRALEPVIIDLNLASAEAYGGVVLPLIAIVQAPSPAGYLQHVYRRAVPTTFSWRPVEAGRHMVTLREQFHNRLFGALEVVVEGETL